MAIFERVFSDEAVLELRRLNDNLERYFDWVGVPRRDATELVGPAKLYVGEPASELEMALREHAELTGQEMKRDD